MSGDMNNALCHVGDHWQMDGDYMCCKSCGRNLIASYDLDESKPPMRHAAGCKQSAKAPVHPWREIRDILLKTVKSKEDTKEVKEVTVPEESGKSFVLFRQEWVESERGWGIRSDGYSYHLTLEDCKTYVDGYCKEFNNKDYAPDCYSRPDGNPELVKVDKNLYTRVFQISTDDKLSGWKKCGTRV